MKKLILSLGIAALALSVSAQNPGLSATAAYDNFLDSDTSTKLTADEYSYQTAEIKWDDALKAPVPTEKAYRGIFWGSHTAVASPRTENFTVTPVRNGKGTEKYTVTQDTGTYGPIYLSFGSYAKPTQKSFTIDLTSNAVLSFSFKNAGTKVVRLSVQVQDIDDTTLVYQPGAVAKPDEYYNYNIGFVQGPGQTAVAPGTTVDFSYDLKTAIVGLPGNKVAPNAMFDYSKVKAVLLTVVDDAAVDPNNVVEAKRDYRPKAIKDYPVEFSNFKLGDVMTITSISNEAVTTSSSEEIVSAYDMLGNFVGTGKIKELGLESGKVYIVKSSSQTRKIVMAK